VYTHQAISAADMTTLIAIPINGMFHKLPNIANDTIVINVALKIFLNI
jgi:hypothetical protein